jgi:hypothetical protein
MQLGGNSLDIAHSVDLAKEFTDLHFRGEYLTAPPKYSNLTKEVSTRYRDIQIILFWIPTGLGELMEDVK